MFLMVLVGAVILGMRLYYGASLLRWSDLLWPFALLYVIAMDCRHGS